MDLDKKKTLQTIKTGFLQSVDVRKQLVTGFIFDGIFKLY